MRDRGSERVRSLAKVRDFWQRICLPMQKMQESSVPGSGRSLEKEMATRSIILAWKTVWTEEPGGLESMVSQSRMRLSTHSQQELRV